MGGCRTGSTYLPVGWAIGAIDSLRLTGVISGPSDAPPPVCHSSPALVVSPGAFAAIWTILSSS